MLGIGPGGYRMVYGAELGMTRWDTRVHANNLALELTATTGILGVSAFLAVVLLAARQALRGLRPPRPGLGPSLPAALIAGSVAATAAAFGHGLVDHFLVFAPMAILFWVLLGIGTGLGLGARAGTR